MTDREIQDSLIRALADAPFRSTPDWREQKLADPSRVERFARFLARHFYYERLIHFFKYSRALAKVTGRTPEAVLTGPDFDALLGTLVLGSRASAVAVAKLALEHIRGGNGREQVPYLDDLTAYEQAMMIVESGARVWSDGGSAEATRKQWSAPIRVEGTMLYDFAYDLPAVLPLLLQPWTEVPQPARQRTRLLLARSRHGRVSVARTSATIDTLLELADGRKSLDDLAREAGLRPAELQATLEGLVDIGAVRFSHGS